MDPLVLCGALGVSQPASDRFESVVIWLLLEGLSSPVIIDPLTH